MQQGRTFPPRHARGAAVLMVITVALLAFAGPARAQIGSYTIERNAYELVMYGETTISEAMQIDMAGVQS